MSTPKQRAKPRKKGILSKIFDFGGTIFNGIRGVLGGDLVQSVLAPVETALPLLTPILDIFRGGQNKQEQIAQETGVKERLKLTTSDALDGNYSELNVIPPSQGSRAPVPPGLKDLGNLYSTFGAQAIPHILNAVTTGKMPTAEQMFPQALQLTANDWMNRNMGPLIERAIEQQIGFINDNGLEYNQSHFIDVPY